MDWLSIKEFIRDTIKYIILVVIVFVVAVYVVGLQQVVGPSMQSTLNNGDVVILNKIGYKFTNIKRKDIVSLYDDESKYLIKRIIGLPGEYIEYKDNKLYVNNELINEEYLKENTPTNFKLNDLGYNKIPEDMYLVLGDNRTNSFDSRDSKLGLIHKKNIIGKVSFRIWPLNKISKLK